jgi:hypothetical protein
MKVVLAAVVKIGVDAIVEEFVIMNAINVVIKHKPMAMTWMTDFFLVVWGAGEIIKDNNYHATPDT